MQLAQHIPTWIASKMTPVLQLTDTDLAFPCKRAAQVAKEELARQMRAAALKAGRPASFACGTEEIMKKAQAAHRSMVIKTEKENVVLAGLRRNGMLNWRSNLSSGKINRTESWASRKLDRIGCENRG